MNGPGTSSTPTTSVSAVSNTGPERRDTVARTTSPPHDASVMANPSQPGQWSKAPSSANTAVAAACHTMFQMASSPVSQAAKKLVPMNCQRDEGRNALNVNQAPITLTARKTHDMASIVRFPLWNA